VIALDLPENSSYRGKSSLISSPAFSVRVSCHGLISGTASGLQPGRLQGLFRQYGSHENEHVRNACLYQMILWPNLICHSLRRFWHRAVLEDTTVTSGISSAKNLNISNGCGAVLRPRTFGADATRLAADNCWRSQIEPANSFGTSNVCIAARIRTGIGLRTVHEPRGDCEGPARPSQNHTLRASSSQSLAGPSRAKTCRSLGTLSKRRLRLALGR